MYVGRIVAVGRTRAGANAVLYRVSSRSFPNRSAALQGGAARIAPRQGHEADLLKNPYIAYNCVRCAADWAIATNGSQTDPIAEKIAAGVPPRDALVSVLLALDYEKDEFDTPRIAAAVPLRGERGWLASVRRDGLSVREVALAPGRAQWLATYEAQEIRPEQSAEFDARVAEDAARAILSGPGFCELERPVTAAAALAGPGQFALAALDAEPD